MATTTSTFPFSIKEKSNDTTKLIPFNPYKHGDTFFKLSSPHPEIYSHMPVGPFNSATDFKREFLESPSTSILSFSNPESLAFAIIDKTRAPSAEDPEGELAGTVSFIRTSPVHLCTEIGFIVVLPPYQRTHVAKNAVGLALQLALDPPERGGLGLRRVDWRASTSNQASAKLAEKMGFEYVGTVPWHIRFVKGKLLGKIGNGKELPPGSDPEDVWRDTVNYCLAWDRWEESVREKVQKIMD
jgi:RimJ/RimL family protein N-acetyltransferase